MSIGYNLKKQYVRISINNTKNLTKIVNKLLSNKFSHHGV